MYQTSREIYSSEIKESLNLAKLHIDKLILEVESNADWLILHQHIKVVIMFLRNAIKLLAERHVDICVLNKYKKNRLKLQTNDINEVIKAYRYLG